jgi:predicted nucleic acid-binding protein
MKAVFVDTHYLVASINPLDQWHERALQAEQQLTGIDLVTTEEVLVETLNLFLLSRDACSAEGSAGGTPSVRARGCGCHSSD